MISEEVLSASNTWQNGMFQNSYIWSYIWTYYVVFNIALTLQSKIMWSNGNIKFLTTLIYESSGGPFSHVITIVITIENGPPELSY